MITGIAAIPIVNVIISGEIPFARKYMGRIITPMTLFNPSVKYRLPNKKYFR
jgi:hypothetical protein